METLGRHSQRLKELRRRVRSRRPGEVILDGRRLVADVVAAGARMRELYFDPERVGEGGSEAVFAAAEKSWAVEGSVLDEIAPTRHPQGVVAVVDEPGLPSWSMTEGLGVVLDGVQDPTNVGAIIRSAAALGARAVLLCEGCPDPLHWAAVRASAGAVFRVPVETDVNMLEIMERIRAAGGRVWATGSGGETLGQWRPVSPALLLLGAEGRGLERELLTAADSILTIPMERGVESLNVAAAAAICLWAYRAL
jgi:TrmH family RNA methyltransferase